MGPRGRSTVHVLADGLAISVFLSALSKFSPNAAPAFFTVFPSGPELQWSHLLSSCYPAPPLHQPTKVEVPACSPPYNSYFHEEQSNLLRTCFAFFTGVQDISLHFPRGGEGSQEETALAHSPPHSLASMGHSFMFLRLSSS